MTGTPPTDHGGVTERDDFTFGECEGLCGRMVERVGWDRFCFACQDEMREEDEEREARMDEEDAYLYGGS